uniref:Uncharacterized protein n=1 Tax=Rhipicephalus appendiculatus TaxID=34631 RepID=A0A131YWG2_RHIAP
MEIEFVCLLHWVLAHSDACGARGGQFCGHPRKRERGLETQQKLRQGWERKAHDVQLTRQKLARDSVGAAARQKENYRKLWTMALDIEKKREGAAAPTASTDAKRKVRIPAATMQKAPTGEKSRQPSTVSARQAFFPLSTGCLWLKRDRHLIVLTSHIHRTSRQRYNFLRQAHRPTLQ